jgi:hypothetical protein
MIKYKLIGHEHCWDGDCFLSDIPSDGFMPTIKKESLAKKFHKENEEITENCITSWGLTFEKIGESEGRPIPKKKPIKRKKGK